ncbi:MAG: glycoside hydrolase family 9 protein [Saprospiraceae bacterium]
MRNNLLFSLSLIFFIFSNNIDAQVVCNDVNNDNICDFSDFIHVDQFGYLENAEKVAVISNPQVGFNAGQNFTPSATLQLIDASNDVVVFSGASSIWNNGATHTQSGDQGWWFDFSSVTTLGEYFIYDPIQEVRSPTFKINDNVYGDVLKAAVKMFYYNRCNATKVAPYAGANWTDGMNFMNNLQDGNCRYVGDQGNASLEKDLSGGWFDAGDYNKYVTFTFSTVHDLLWAYQENPIIFGDDWGIPESGNGIPDILDEVKWELDWLLKMTNVDGSVHIKMGSISYNVNIAAPPSANTGPRYYGPTCTSASISNAGVFAHAAKVFSAFSTTSAFATTLENEAISTWDYALPFLNNNTLEINCDDGTITAGDADWSAEEQKENAVAAAAYLFDLTNDNSYSQYLITNINDTEPMANDYWGGSKIPIHDALLNYMNNPNANSTTVSSIITSFAMAANNNWEDYHGFSSADLYRSFMPDYSYHWGSNRPKANYGILNLQLSKNNLNVSSVPNYKKKTAQQLHYFHGVNPMGLVYLSNMYDFGGDRCVNEVYHTWFYDGTDWDNALTSLYGPAPGFVPGGANKDFTVTTITPPYGQPTQKSYLEFNSGFPTNSWEITEPGIYYQAAYIRLLASQTLELTTTPLPVDLIYFNVEVTTEKTVKLTWKSATEINNDFYEIQRSQDGIQFERLAQVDGKGTTNLNSVYTAIDSTPLEGVSYYRIKQVDFDGNTSVFPIKSVFFERSTFSVSLQPNPAKDQLNIFIDSKVNEKLEIVLISIDGNVLLEKGNITIAKGGDSIPMEINKLVNGIYFVKIRNLKTGEITVKKMTVAK